MTQRILRLIPSRSLLPFLAVLLCTGMPALAQNSGLELHANDHASAEKIGLPSYPGATPYKAPDNDATIDMGYSFGDSHFRLMVANFETSDAGAKVLDYYRKPLSRYGEVLECEGDKPVGKLTTTRSGLTCSDEHSGNVQVNAHSDADGHELRAGTPEKFRVVEIDKAEPNSTRFALVYIELPKDQAEKK